MSHYVDQKNFTTAIMYTYICTSSDRLEFIEAVKHLQQRDLVFVNFWLIVTSATIWNWFKNVHNFITRELWIRISFLMNLTLTRKTTESNKTNTLCGASKSIVLLINEQSYTPCTINTSINTINRPVYQ